MHNPRVASCLAMTLAWLALGANYSTANFMVTAPTKEIAQRVGEQAERFRREKALEWLGREMPPWGVKCSLKVTLTPSQSGGGATSFVFQPLQPGQNPPTAVTIRGEDGQVMRYAMHTGIIQSIDMEVEGPLERILNSVLPHEITHTVFAYHFRCPLPRWADEGGSVLSEDDLERRRHDKLIREGLAWQNGMKAFRLRTLFEMMKYPRSGADVMTLYAQGYSIVRFVVEHHGRQVFLEFVADGLRYGWDQSIRAHLKVNRVEDLEEAWLAWMRRGMRRDDTLAVATPTREPQGRTTSALPPQAKGPTTPRAVLQTPDFGKPDVVRGARPDDSARPTGRPTGRSGFDKSSSDTGTADREGWSPLGTANTPGQRRPAIILPPQAP